MEKASLLDTHKKFLVCAAHPDDFDFGSAATIARLTDEGHEAVYCVITNGEKGTHAVKGSREEMMHMREEEQYAAGRCVGVTEVHFLREIDGELEHTAQVRREVTKVIRMVKPDIVMSFDPANQRFDHFGRFHRDHRLAAEIVFDAIYPAAGSDAYNIELTEEGYLPHQIEEAWFFNTTEPNFFVDVSDYLDTKLRALKAHASQIPDIPAMEQRIRDRAIEAARDSGMYGVLYAEAFRRLSF